MATPDGTLLRDFRHPQQAAFVELLFDVVFVFAFTRLTAALAARPGWLGAYEALLLLMAMWWIWYRMAWTTNRYNPGQPAIQWMIIATMLGSLLLATALPSAFTNRGVVFASVYVAVEVFRHLWLVFLRGSRSARLTSLRIVFWAALSAGPWIVGGLRHNAAQVAWWTAAVCTDYAGGILDFPTPALGKARLRSQTVAERHLTERYRQVLIIAFGEAILTSGIEFSQHNFEGARTAALLVAFVTTVLMWQIYFYRAGELLPVAIAASRAPAHVSDLASYGHLIMVAGTGLSSVGDMLTITYPLGYTNTRHVLLVFGGPALFLLGRAILDYAAFTHVSWSRPIGVLVLAALVPAGLRLPPVTAAALPALALAGIAIANVIAWRLFPREPAPPRPG